MDQERSRIQEDLRGQLAGEVLCDDLTLQLYSMDASIHSIKPTGVVRPTSVEDVVNCLKYASEHHLAVHPRGSGSNFVGSTLGPGLILDFAYSMRKVTKTDDDSLTLQAGAVLGNINRFLERTKRTFGPDPINRVISTFGGMCNINASGSNWLRYGSASDNILDVEFVLSNGTVINTANSDRNLQSILTKLDLLGQRRTESIQRPWPKTPVNSAGYYLPALLPSNETDSPKQRLIRLLCGSEGTLGVVTELRVRTCPIPNHSGVLLLFFDGLEKAARAALDVANREVAACDLLDRRILTIARDVDPQYSRLIPEATESLVFIEIHAETSHELSSRIDGLLDRFARRRNQAFGWRSASHPLERTWFWNIVRRAIPRLSKLKGRRRALPFMDDFCVPPAKLPELLLEVQSRLNRYDVTGALFSHVGQSVVRAYPLLDMANSEHRATMNDLSQDLHEYVIGLGGTISGSHGDGHSRSLSLRKQYGRLSDVFAEVKTIFDPARILNPDVIVGAGNEQLTDRIRITTLAPTFSTTAVKDLNAEVVAMPGNGTPPGGVREESRKTRENRKKRKLGNDKLLQLNWNPDEMLLATRNCNGCGRCRTTSETERMCPIFRVLPREEASPRAKANLMRGILTGTLNHSTIKSEEFKSLVDLCVNCHQCRLECPANVDIPKMMVEAKAQYVAVNGLKMSQWLLTRLDLLYEFGARFPGITNWTIRTPFLRWCVEKLFGISQARKLPTFAKRSFLRWAISNKLTTPTKGNSKKVLYFVDAYANWNDPELAKATVKVLIHNGFEVYIPPEQLISGMSMISAGLVERARKIATRNVELLAESVRQGYRIVTTEPSAALALQHEYLNFLTDHDAKLVAENTFDINSFLWKLHQQGQLALNFNPLNAIVGYHLPCHLKALRDSVPGWELLKLIPGLRVDKIEKGCSGMAGIYGLMSSNYRRSLRAGIGLINAVRSQHFMAGTTECSTCKIQMEQGSTKPTIHPIKILALSYKLDTELQDLFDRRSERLVIS